MPKEIVLKNCRGCPKQFTPKKSFHSYCDSCVRKLAKCGKCGQMVLPKNTPKGAFYEHCGVKESAEPSRLRGRSFDEMVFILENNMTYSEAAAFHGMDDFNEPPNS